MNKSQSQYTYPSNLNDLKYKYRKVTIKVKESKLAVDGAQAKTLAQEAISVVNEKIKSSANTVKEMTGNIQHNKQAKTDLTKIVISLPVPNSFEDSQDHQWDQTSGIIGTAGKSIMDNSAGSIISSIMGKRAGKKLGKGATADAISSATSNATSKVSNVLDKAGVGNITVDHAVGAMSAFAGLRKPLIDPGYFQNYTGSTPRSFSMEWDFIPCSAEEADTIIAIIMKLKQIASPKSTINGVSLLAPYYLDVKFSNDVMSSMVKLDRCVITNITVDYGADGAMQQTVDGMPKYIKFRLSLNEVDMSTSSDYDHIPNRQQPTQ